MFSQTVVNWVPHGRLCNQIFPFANLLALSAETGCQVLTTGLSVERGCFEGTGVGLVPGYPAFPFSAAIPDWLAKPARPAFSFGIRGLRRFRLGSFREINADRYFDLGPSGEVQAALKAGEGPVMLDGPYLIHSEALTKYGDLVRNYFRPVATIRSEIDPFIQRAKATADVLVAVHVRHGDYATFLGGSLFRDSSFYASLMRQMVDLLAPREVRFLVCSDATQDPATFQGLHCTFGLGRPVPDLYSLAQCDYLISTGSTYAQWASFYGRVPRYLIPHQKPGDPADVPELRLEDFHVHDYGFGAFSASPTP